jgi:hypothetical protein
MLVALVVAQHLIIAAASASYDCWIIEPEGAAVLGTMAKECRPVRPFVGGAEAIFPNVIGLSVNFMTFPVPSQVQKD